MIIWSILIVVIVFVLVVLYYMNGQLKLKYLTQYLPKDFAIKNGEMMLIGDQSYHVFYLYAPIKSVVTINSPTYIEIKKGKKTELMNTINLKEKHLIIVYPTQERMLRVMNENEVKFIDKFERVYQSYIMYPQEVEAFIKAHQ